MGRQNRADRQGWILAICNEIFHFTGWPWPGGPLRLILGDVPERSGARPILTASSENLFYPFNSSSPLGRYVYRQFGR
jgi:hypothetical protein